MNFKYLVDWTRKFAQINEILRKFNKTNCFNEQKIVSEYSDWLFTFVSFTFDYLRFRDKLNEVYSMNPWYL